MQISPTDKLNSNTLTELNISPREKMSILIKLFLEFYHSKNYFEHEQIKISTGLDPTVQFIGSHISVYKKYLISKKIPITGYYMMQKCVRTQNLKNCLRKDNIPFKYSSYFYSLGVLAPTVRLEKVCSEFFEFLNTKLKINLENIKIRISSRNKPLIQACIQAGMQNNLEIDTKPELYYIHKLGMVDYIGNSFNIAIWDKKLEYFSDVGNIILIKHKNEPIAIEVAFGAGIMTKTLLGLDHVLDCYELEGLTNKDPAVRIKFEDTLITCMALYEDGLRPKKYPTKNRTLGTYVKLLSYFRRKTNVSITELKNILKEFQHKEFQNLNKDLSAEIINYLNNFERKKGISEEFYKKMDSNC